MPSRIYEDKNIGLLDYYAACLSSYSSMLFSKADPSIELFAYHQEIHTRKELNRHELDLLSLVEMHLVDFVNNINEFIMIGLFDEESEKKYIQVH